MNLKIFTTLSLAASLVFLAACKSPSVVSPEDGNLTSGKTPPGMTKKVGPGTGMEVPKGTELPPPTPIKEWQGTDNPLPDVGGLDNPTRWEGGAVYFAFDNDSVLETERPKVDTVVKFMTANEKVCVLVEGHCDDRGSDEYNRGLGERRANAIRNYMTAAGISADRILTVSFGEERPAVANAATEEQHQLNRRGEFVFGTVREKLLPAAGAAAPAAAPAAEAAPAAATPVEVAPAPAPVEVGS